MISPRHLTSFTTAAIFFAATGSASASPAPSGEGVTIRNLTTFARSHLTPPPAVIVPAAPETAPASAPISQNTPAPIVAVPEPTRSIATIPAPLVVPSVVLPSPPLSARMHPAWAQDAIEPSTRASVLSVVPGTADIVLLDGGLYQGLRVGVVCLAEHQGSAIAEVIVVSSQLDRAAALITKAAPGATIQPGDEVHLKALPVLR